MRLLSKRLPLKWRLRAVNFALETLMATRLSDPALKATHRACLSGDFILSGFFDRPSGIGRAAELTRLGLEQAGFSVRTLPLDRLLRHTVTGALPLGGSEGVWLIHANAPEALMALLAYKPSEWVGRFRIAYWAWETSKVPELWVRAAEYFHEIWVPSAFVKAACQAGFEAAGLGHLTSRLKIMPHPVSLRPEAVPDRAAFGLSDDKIEVLSLFDIDSSVVRKNPWGAVGAWLKAFDKPTESARLTLKLNGNERDEKLRQNLAFLQDTRPDIRLFDVRLDDAGADQFIASFDGLISLHRAEGFGLSLAEAMRAGLWVMASDTSGNQDFMTSENAYLVPVKTIPVSDPDGPYALISQKDGQFWTDPDLDAAAEMLKTAIESRAVPKIIRRTARADMKLLPEVWQSNALAYLNSYIRI